MAIKFIDWPFAFKKLQRAFNLSPVISIPPTLHNQLKPEFSSINPSINPLHSSNPPSISQNNSNSNFTQNQKNPLVNPHPTTQKNITNNTYPNNPFNFCPANSTSNTNPTTRNNSSHNLIYSPSIKANSIHNLNKTPKNNYLNNKQLPPPQLFPLPTLQEQYTNIHKPLKLILL